MDLGPALGAADILNLCCDKFPIDIFAVINGINRSMHQYAIKQCVCNDTILLQQVHVVTQTRSRLKFKSNEDNPVRIKQGLVNLSLPC